MKPVSTALLLMAAVFSLESQAATTATVTRGSWNLYKSGSSTKVSSHASETDCVNAAKALNVTQTYSCKLTTSVSVTVTADTTCPSRPADESRAQSCPSGTTGSGAGVSPSSGTGHTAGIIGPGQRFSVIEIADPRLSLAVGTFQSFIDRFIERGGAASVDYVHGDDALEQLATTGRNVGFHLPVVSKSDLLRMVVRDGALPRKTFSMGEADEKRFYIEARRIRPG